MKYRKLGKTDTDMKNSNKIISDKIKIQIDLIKQLDITAGNYKKIRNLTLNEILKVINET